jgi:cytochrome c biogenesis factor
LVIYFLLYLLYVKVSLTTNSPDILTNTYVNDFYLNNFYIIWTQFYILPTFFSLIYTKYITIDLKTRNFIIVLYLYFLFSTMLFWVINYYYLNQYVYCAKNIQYHFNNLLYNPLNKYHPFLFFTTYIFIYTFIKPYCNMINPRIFTTLYHVKFTSISYITGKVNIYWCVLLFSIYLGAWWALQEGSWGGWWNWDASEVFGLIVLTYLLTSLHSILSSFMQTVKLIYVLYASTLTLFTYGLLQMGYSVVSHNFGLSLIGYGYTQLAFTLLIV